jgi:hypothetical protein
VPDTAIMCFRLQFLQFLAALLKEPQGLGGLPTLVTLRLFPIAWCPRDSYGWCLRSINAKDSSIWRWMFGACFKGEVPTSPNAGTSPCKQYFGGNS